MQAPLIPKLNDLVPGFAVELMILNCVVTIQPQQCYCSYTLRSFDVVQSASTVNIFPECQADCSTELQNIYWSEHSILQQKLQKLFKVLSHSAMHSSITCVFVLCTKVTMNINVNQLKLTLKIIIKKKGKKTRKFMGT